MWEGGPSIALVYGKIARVIIRCVILFVIAYFAITMGLPALASISAQASSFIDQNTTGLELGIVAVLALAVIPSVVGLLQALAQIKNTHYKVTNQRIVIETGVLSK